MGRAIVIDWYTPGSPSGDQGLELFSQDELGCSGIYEICPDHMIGKVNGVLLLSVPFPPELLVGWPAKRIITCKPVL